MDYKDMQAYLQSSDINNFFLLAGPCAIEGEEITMTSRNAW